MDGEWFDIAVHPLIMEHTKVRLAFESADAPGFA